MRDTTPAQPTAASFLRPTDAWVRFLLPMVLVFAAQASDGQLLADFWHHLARGQWILEQGRLLDEDIFTYTVAGTSFRDVNWLTQCLYAGLFEIGGLALVQTVNALVFAAALGWLAALCRRISGSLLAATGIVLLVFLGLWQVLTIRPQSFSLLLFVIWLDLLERSIRRPMLLLWGPFLLALWANLHGAFPIGLYLIGVFGLEETLRLVRERRWPRHLTRLIACFLGSAAATLANPYGWKIWIYVGLTSNRAAERGIDEWLPPSFDQWIGAAFFVSLPLVVLLATIAWRRGRRPTMGEIVLLACFLPLAALSIRMVAWWLLAAAPVAACWLAACFPQARDEPHQDVPTRAAALVVLGLMLFAVFSTPWLAPVNPLLALRRQERPEVRLQRALEEIKGRMGHGNVFARLEWGEYLGWAGQPEFKVFLDGRIEIYPDPVWADYARITQGQDGWNAALQRYGTDVLVLDADYHARTGLWAKVATSPQWRLLWRQEEVAVFGK